MFNNQVDDGTDFCEAYKSEILGNSTVQEKPSNMLLKVLTILLLLIVIIALSIYSYTYITKDNSISIPIPPSSIQMIDDDELVVAPEDEEPPVEPMPPQSNNLDKNDKTTKEAQLLISKTDNKIAINNKVLEIPLEVPTSIQSEYNDLEKLSKEIDKELK